MPDRIKFLQGYRGKLTKEAYIEAGQVVEVGEEVADYLEAGGVAERTRDAATYGLTGPLDDGAGQPEPDERKDPPTREEQLSAMPTKKLAKMLITAGQDHAYVRSLNKTALVEQVLQLEAASVSAETAS